MNELMLSFSGPGDDDINLICLIDSN